jgi:hypothetical protein
VFQEEAGWRNFAREGKFLPGSAEVISETHSTLVFVLPINNQALRTFLEIRQSAKRELAFSVLDGFPGK